MRALSAFGLVLTMFLRVQRSMPIRHRTLPRRRPRTMMPLSSTSYENDNTKDTASETSDVLLQALSADQDVTVKIVSCRELIQEHMIKQDLSQQAGTALAELTACTLLLGAGLKDEEQLQINLVSAESKGFRNLMVITDGECRARGQVGDPRFQPVVKDGMPVRMRDMLGEGQIQVVRSHPTWKHPTNGIVALRDAKIPLNLGLYLQESEQRRGALLTDVLVEGSLVRHALGILVENLPGAYEWNVDASVRQLGAVEAKGLRSYLDFDESPSGKGEWRDGFRDFEPALRRMLADTLGELGQDFCVTKKPTFRCSCGIEKVWRTLALLSKEDVQSIVDGDEDIEIKCEFCATKYSVTRKEVKQRLLDLAK